MIVGIAEHHRRGMLEHHIERQRRHLGFASIAIFAAMLAWGLSIRNRDLAVRLDRERAERRHLDRLGLAAAGLAHEIKNPLGIILGHAQRLRKSPPQETTSMTRPFRNRFWPASSSAMRRAHSPAQTAAARGDFAKPGGGSLFLDEIGDMPLELQPDLLRSLETNCVSPVGSDRDEHVDYRLIAATNADLEAAVEAKSFRSDLF